MTSYTVEVTPFLVVSRDGKRAAFEHRRQLRHLRWVGARAVQVGAAGAVDGAGVLAVQRQDVAAAAGRVLQVDVGQAFPAAPDADHLPSDLTGPVDNRFDDRVQPGDVATASQDTDALRGHEYAPYLARTRTTMDRGAT